jgi:glutamate decarboxylase
MTLHAKVKGDELDRQHLSVNPLYVREGESTALPKHRMPDGPMMPDTAYEIVHDELMLDGNARLNLATFVTTWMESQAGKLMAECFDKNMIDKDEYPQTAELEMRCVNMLSRLWNSPSADVATGCLTTGSSEACMLGGLALKRRWQHRRRSEGKSAERPIMVMGINVQVCWEKFCRYWDVEPRYVPMEGNRFHLNGEEAIFSEDREDLAALRVVVRNGFSRNLANPFARRPGAGRVAA